MVDPVTPGQKPRQIGIPPQWLDVFGGALVEHGSTLGSFGDWLANARDQIEIRLLKKPSDQEAVLRYLHHSHGDDLPKLFVDQCAPVIHPGEDLRPIILSVSAFATSAHLNKEVLQRLNYNGLDTHSLPYHGPVSTFTELKGRTLEQELSEVRSAAYGLDQPETDLKKIPSGVFPIGAGFSAGALKVLSVTLNAAEAGELLPFKGLLLTSMPPQLTNETLGPLLEGAYRRFRYAQATVEPNINFPMPVDMATVFADTPPWPKWLGTLDRAPLSAIISIRRMQELIMNKIKFLPTDFPIFVIHSEDDDLCNVACAKDFFDQIPSRQKEFIRVPGPHLPLISQAVTVKDGLQISENDASMHRSTANNLMFDCFIELMNLTDQ